MGLAGIMFWAPDLDDFSGSSCNEGKYPLINTAVNVLHGKPEVSTSTKAPTSPTTMSTTTPETFQDGKRVVCYYTKYVLFACEIRAYLRF